MRYTLGLDIGIASVGWCLLTERHIVEERRIVDLGVRAFDKAETADKGESLNLARRTARLTRRRLCRRAGRLKKLARLLAKTGLIASADFFAPGNPYTGEKKSLWQLRAEGLDRRLDSAEWARVIYHLVKHRGFHWISKADEKAAEADTKGEGGKVTTGLAGTKKLMVEKNYRTAAEMVLAEFPDAQRNKRGEYTKALSRVLLADELALLFKEQRGFGNPHADAALEAEILGNGDKKSGIFWQQKPALSGAALLKMLGSCTFEKTEDRAPKASFTAERHVWLTRLNNLRITVDGRRRELTQAERQVILPLPYAQVGDFTYKQLRNALVQKGFLEKDSFKFAGLSYPSENEKEKLEKKKKDPEEKALAKLNGWQTLRKQMESSGLKTEWESMAGAAHNGNPQQLDEIARVLSVYKEGDEVEAELSKLHLPGGAAMIEALSEISFSQFSNLSLKALYKILPFMEQGERYDEACVKAGYHHSQLFGDNEKDKYLKSFYKEKRDEKGRKVFRDPDIPRNPVVLRALNQARKVVNAVVRNYGSPEAVHIEMARDLSKPLKGHWTSDGKYIEGRQDIEKEQKAFRDRNDEDKEEFARQFNIMGEVTGRNFRKWQLYREQSGKCAYSLGAIDLRRLLEDHYVEVDHILPRSRFHDYSKNNEVLVLDKENQNKGNRTSYEYLTSFAGGEESERWRQFEAFVKSNKNYRQAKLWRLLGKSFDEEGLSERNLNDTRYICRFFKNYIERFLQLREREDGTTAQRCVVLSGQMTAFLRARWGLLKSRAESDRHHALDAAVVAACSHAMVKRLSDYSRKKELEQVRQGFVDPETGEILDRAALLKIEKDPMPWEGFRKELEARLKIDDIEKLREEIARLGTYDEAALEAIRPLFVSRAPQRRNSGAAHKDTIYGKPRSEHHLKVIDKKTKSIRTATAKELNALAVERVGVFETRDKGKKYKLTADRLDDMVDVERNEWMLKSLRLWLKERGDNPKKPGTDCFPKKPLKSDPENGPFSGPAIKKIKLIKTSKSGAYVRNGIAECGEVVFTKLYRQDNEFLFLPCYEMPDKDILGRTSIPADAIDTGIDLYSNDVVRIAHPNLSHCYKVVKMYKDKETGEELIDVVAAFPSGVFIGYWAYFEPSNDRPVVQMHDSATFFLLEADKKTDQKTLTLIVEKNKTKKGDDCVYIEKSPPSGSAPLKFSRVKDIKRKINSAQMFEKLHVDVLGNLYPASPEPRCGLA